MVCVVTSRPRAEDDGINEIQVAHFFSLTTWTDLQAFVPVRASIYSRTRCGKVDALSNMPLSLSFRHSPSCGSHSALSPFIIVFNIFVAKIAFFDRISRIPFEKSHPKVTFKWSRGDKVLLPALSGVVKTNVLTLQR